MIDHAALRCGHLFKDCIGKRVKMSKGKLVRNFSIGVSAVMAMGLALLPVQAAPDQASTTVGSAITRSSSFKPSPQSAVTYYATVRYAVVYCSGAPCGVKIYSGSLRYEGGYNYKGKCGGSTLGHGIKTGGFYQGLPGEINFTTAFNGGSQSYDYVRSFNRSNSSGWTVYRSGSFAWNDTGIGADNQKPYSSPTLCGIGPSDRVLYRFARDERSDWLWIGP